MKRFLSFSLITSFLFSASLALALDPPKPIEPERKHRGFAIVQLAPQDWGDVASCWDENVCTQAGFIYQISLFKSKVIAPAPAPTPTPPPATEHQASPTDGGPAPVDGFPDHQPGAGPDDPQTPVQAGRGTEIPPTWYLHLGVTTGVTSPVINTDVEVPTQKGTAHVGILYRIAGFISYVGGVGQFQAFDVGYENWYDLEYRIGAAARVEIRDALGVQLGYAWSTDNDVLDGALILSIDYYHNLFSDLGLAGAAPRTP